MKSGTGMEQSMPVLFCLLAVQTGNDAECGCLLVDKRFGMSKKNNAVTRGVDAPDDIALKRVDDLRELVSVGNLVAGLLETLEHTGHIRLYGAEIVLFDGRGDVSAVAMIF